LNVFYINLKFLNSHFASYVSYRTNILFYYSIMQHLKDAINQISRPINHDDNFDEPDLERKLLQTAVALEKIDDQWMEFYLIWLRYQELSQDFRDWLQSAKNRIELARIGDANDDNIQPLNVN